MAEVAEQVVGTVFALLEPHDAGTVPARRAAAVSRPAYDHVNAEADSGAPVSRWNCSASVPSSGVYFSTILMYPSAYVCTAEMRALNVDEPEAYVPVTAEE